MEKIAILASGTGTNAERIIRYFAEQKTAEVAVVITNKAQAGVVERAGRLGIPAVYLTGEAFEGGELMRVLDRYGVGFVVLAGFLKKVPDAVLQAYPDRIVNIHPALLPKFGGKGMYGNRVHEAVLAAGEAISGITIHYINEHYDEGGVIYQATCPVLPEDTPDTLAQRVHSLEYACYPRVIEDLVLGRELSL